MFKSRCASHRSEISMLHIRSKIMDVRVVESQAIRESPVLQSRRIAGGSGKSMMRAVTNEQASSAISQSASNPSQESPKTISRS